MGNNIKILIGLVILAVLIPLVIAATYVVEGGSGTTSFNVSQGEKVTSNSIVINNASSGCDVELNGHNQGNCDSVNSLDNNDFRNRWVYNSGWTWQGNNQITFTGSIDNFTLTYNTGGLNGGDGEYCSNDNQCSGVCLFNKCCSHDTNADPPIYFVSPITSSCPDSSIPIETHLNCGDRTSNNYKNIDILFWLGTTRLTPNNADINHDTIMNDECTVESGVTGWDLDGEIRCGANVDVTTGTYVLKATYTVEGHSYTVTINNSFQVAASCSSDTPCGHAGSAQLNLDGTIKWIDEIYYSSPVATSGEIKNYGGDNWAVKPGTTIKVGDISGINAQCSNGVPYNIRQGFATWDSTGIVSDSLITCDISNVTRNSLIGDFPGVSDKGYKPSTGTCNLALTQTQNTEVGLGTFVNPGDHNIKMDMINAICDSPDYICPDLTVANPNRATLCKIGSMITPERADGWVPLKDYNFKVVNSNISYVETLRYQTDDVLTVNYNITNIGIGRIKIINSSISALTDFKVNCSNCPLGGTQEGQTRLMVVNIESKNVKSNNIMNSPVPFNYTTITLKNYNSVSSNLSNVVLNYSASVSVTYDDDYGLSTYGSFAKSNNINFNMNFKCNASDEKYALNLTDRIFYCTCEGRGFCEDLKTGNDNPCACIDSPKKSSVIEGLDVWFNASRSFDDITNPGSLMFKWSYTGASGNNTIYENNGTSGAIFQKHFAAPGPYFVKLEVNDSSKVGIDNTNFVLVVPGLAKPFCLSTQLIWVEPSGSRMPSLDDCYRANGNNTQYCCPVGRECINPGTGNWYCNSTASNISRCSDYDTEPTCIADNKSVSQMSVNEKLTNLFCDKEHRYNSSCWEFVGNCRCSWKSNKCIASWDYALRCDNNTEINSGTCEVTDSWITDNCQLQGVMDVIWDSIWIGGLPKPADCGSGHRFVPCERAMGLNFINIYSLLIGTIVIILIYCYMVWKKKK